MNPSGPERPGAFAPGFRADLARLMDERRDVRRFRTDAVDEAALTRCLDAFLTAPSVGLSEPWRVIRVESPAARAAALANFEDANAAALADQSDDRAALYARLKLSGMRDAPVQLAVWCDESTEKGHGLGAATMPEMRRYSVVAAIVQFWLTARAEGLGAGWVSILDPERLARDLDVPEGWALVGYLCVGWPERLDRRPELEIEGWESRRGHLPVETR
ncbi:5,6-dimethylbenzimidazole synthase [Limimaricola pyoseonensis]|uniref:Cob(II)yrinic acid a,c-diamide reductase n=1 Tax=Limimaricola pyoseonensis TaxID=521013 RepID=A0A1G7BXD3_9RHOB|nr:5,6-dimethylbenzimidazole synthase [Limimaricola pyoseonensis]SDE31781.1 cob(II)yrinic acid a,c-diamide reductase [Limimaricola pyoseonensis]